MADKSIPTRGRTLDHAAKVYDLLEPVLLLGKQAEYDQTIIRLLELKESDRILDLGCGTGVLTKMIANRLTAEKNARGISWTGQLPEVFKKRYGYNLIKYLPEISFDITGQKVSQARYHYFDCISFLFTDAFGRQIGQWCDRNHMQHTGHLLAEDTLRSQVEVVGNCMRFYEYMQAPGMDLLTEHRRLYNTAKQVS